MILNINIVNLFFLIFIIPISLLLEGIRRKLIARMQNRAGPPILQPFYDIEKLFNKNTDANKKMFFRFVPLIYLITTFSLFLFAPFPLIDFNLDFIALIFIFILSGTIYTMLGIFSNSTHGYSDSIRSIFLMIFYDLIFAIVIFTFVSFTEIQSLTNFNEKWLILNLPAVSICLLIIPLIELKIKSYETIEAYTEMIGNAEMEFSGRELAFLEISKNLKLTFFVFLTSLLLFGFKNLIMFSIFSLFILFIITFITAITCRYRLDQVIIILIIVLLFAIFELIRVNFIM